MMQMAKYLVDNRAAITTRLKEMKKPTLTKLELENERLYKSLDGSTLSERLETYSLISDVRLRIEKLAKLSEMIDEYINIARKLSKVFDIVLVKELFSSLVIEKFDMYLTVSLGGEALNTVPSQHSLYFLDKTITQKFKEKNLRFNLFIN
jgi:hypothetical protein